MSEKPNLFKFATSELSQDAVLAYMLAWAAPEHAKTTKLHKLGRDLLLALLAESERTIERIGPDSEETPEDEADRIKYAIRQIKADDIKTLDIKCQDNNIDVSLDINESLFVIVEDKTETMRHGDQIRRYKEAAKQRFESDGKSREVVAVYLKTGNESASYHPAPERAGCFFRADVLDVLDKNQNTGSDIIEEFQIHLQRLEDDTKSFKESKLVALDDQGNSEDGWSWNAHQGYFMHLEQKLDWDEKGWGYDKSRRENRFGCDCEPSQPGDGIYALHLRQHPIRLRCCSSWGDAQASPRLVMPEACPRSKACG